ncbi:MAG: hypothetical protein J7479_03430 [Roseiflexus sp.]|nr:hypothetical protein [Roseiflexus sp.]
MDQRLDRRSHSRTDTAEYAERNDPAGADRRHLNAAWAQPFEKQLTADKPFYLLDGSQVMVPMMQHDANWNYLKGESFRVVSVPYDGRELSVVILLPCKGRFKEFERSLDFERVDQTLKGITPHQVLFKMPRFRTGSSLDLRDGDVLSLQT